MKIHIRLIVSNNQSLNLSFLVSWSNFKILLLGLLKIIPMPLSATHV